MNFKILKGPHITGKIFLDHNSILPFAKVMICHGGNGTIYQALAHGVPVLGITSMFEQEWNMQQVRQHGLGESVNDLNEDELLPKIKYWIDHKPKMNFVQEIRNYNTSYRRQNLWKPSCSYRKTNGKYQNFFFGLFLENYFILTPIAILAQLARAFDS